MARKLKSDQVLFLATLLLVCRSVVMVYSASAVWRLERFHQPNLFLIKQVMWAALGVAVLRLVMRIDYRNYRQPVVDLDAASGPWRSACWRCFFAPAANGSRRWFGLGVIGIQPSELAKLAVILFTAAVLERRMHRINERAYVAGAASARWSSLLHGLDPARAGLRHGDVAAADRRADGVRGRPGVPLPRRRSRCARCPPPVVLAMMCAPYRRRAAARVPEPDGRTRSATASRSSSRSSRSAPAACPARASWRGVQKLFYLPEPHTDFIYAVIAEELGLVGATVDPDLLRA